ncbi:86869e7a-93fc-4cce-b448-391485cce003 [Thermothielavioides terrestris]|uniref:86869e7a-93fc-4cce-b448-391485cce003 n=1 Tax=Thermothielavioides terrestris TaxID=2587410 RepID=A0A3S4AQ02_9PEZI|nr:86869e7a-93fc-4cce-b448-391485cce003 [Thermothielavioides terrestris]
MSRTLSTPYYLTEEIGGKGGLEETPVSNLAPSNLVQELPGTPLLGFTELGLNGLLPVSGPGDLRGPSKP